jgi:bifunctional oligoribonuclease and PAP phosphatase NrnA
MNIKKIIKEKINEFQKIIIHSHLEPDGDSFGSQWALKRIIEKN